MADEVQIELDFEPPVDAQNFTVNVALVGPPKTGKSAGAASAPGPILYLNAEVAQRLRYARLKFGDKLQVVQVKNRATLEKAAFAARSGKYETVALDSVGELYDMLLAERASQNTGAMKDKPKLDDYREVGDDIKRFCKMLVKNEKANAVFVFHDHPVKDEETGETERQAWAGTSNPKLSRAILGMVDIVGFTGVISTEGQAKEYVTQLVPGAGRAAGDGFDCLADARGVRAVNLEEWIEVIKESQDGVALEALPDNEELDVGSDHIQGDVEDAPASEE